MSGPRHLILLMLVSSKAGGRSDRAPTANQKPALRQLWPIRGSGSSHTGHRTLGITNISKFLQQTDRKYWTLPASVSETCSKTGWLKRDFSFLQIWEMNKQNTARLFCWRNNIDDLQPPGPGTAESDNWEFVDGQRGNYQGVRYLYWYLSYLWGSCRDCFIYTQPQLSANPTTQSIINTNCSHITS